jgi:hypothetical protein
MIKKFNARLSIDSVAGMVIAQECELAGKDKRFFCDILDNIRADIEVDTETGEAQVVALHGMPFTKALMCIEGIDDLVERSGDNSHKQAWAFLRGFAGKKI